MKRTLSLVLLGLTLVAADWRQFRGTDLTGAAPTEAPPNKFGPTENLAWKADLPGRGLSSPVIVGDRLFLTASSGPKQDRLHVLAFDTATGKQLWQRTLWGTGPTASHPKTCMAAPTPATDGKRLVALFATNDLAAFDLDGNLLWVRSLYGENEGATDGRGLASSPILAGDTVVVLCENQNTSFAAGIDLATGANRWRADRPHDLNWTTPVLLPGPTPTVLLQGASRLSAVEAGTGKEVWYQERNSHPIASSLVVGDKLFLPGEQGLVAFQLTPGQPPKQLWEQNRLGPSTASPVVLGDKIYVLRGAVLTVGDVKTGAVLGQLRLAGAFSSSPVTAGGLIYAFSEDGKAFVVEPGEKDPKQGATTELGEGILCTPAISDQALYVRSDNHLWKFAK